MPLRITIEGTTWTNQRGYGRFLREVLAAAVRLGTPHAFTLVADTSLPASVEIPGVSIVRVPLGVAAGVAASADGHRSIGDMWAMSRALARVPADCLFFPTVYSFVPVWTRAPLVVGIHDVIAERLPEHVFTNARARRFWSSKVWLATKQAARVMTVSRHAADGVTEQLRVPESRIRVVGEAPAAVFRADAGTQTAGQALQAAGVPEGTRFFFYVGGLSPHKNLLGLIDALDRLPADVRLVIAGDVEFDSFLSNYPALVARTTRDGAGRVQFIARPDDGVVAGLMRLAQGFVLPSFDEGFGLPAIEAAACGATVIVTRNSAMPEVLGDAALYVDPYDTASIADAMRRALADASLRATLGAQAAARASGYTWAAAARQLIATFEELRP
jgi:glycosyltransferase involved in cell wall biosynthesis